MLDISFDEAFDITWEEKEGCLVIMLEENDYYILPIVNNKLYFEIGSVKFYANNEEEVDSKIADWKAWQATDKTLSEYGSGGPFFCYEKQA